MNKSKIHLKINNRSWRKGAKAPASQKPHGYYFSRWRNQNINGSTLNPAPKCQAETNHLS